MPLEAPPLFVPIAAQPVAPQKPLASGPAHPRRQPQTGEEWHAFANTICADLLGACDLDQVEKIKADNSTLLEAIKTADPWLARMVSAAFTDKRQCLGGKK